MRGAWPAAALLPLFLFSSSCDFRPDDSPPPVEKKAPAPLRKIPLRLAGGATIQVEVAATPAERERGLMFRRELPQGYGMLFVFPQPMDLQFWMKNTFVSLDIVYVDSAKIVTGVYARVRASTPRTTDEEIARVGGYGQFVLELPSGAAEALGIRVGERIDFDASIPYK